MKKAFIDQNFCVACGCCLTACKLNAVSISKGVCATVDYSKCVGCGMCAKKCPASLITIKEESANE